jgi:hypothetical protein
VIGILEEISGGGGGGGGGVFGEERGRERGRRRSWVVGEMSALSLFDIEVMSVDFEGFEEEEDGTRGLWSKFCKSSPLATTSLVWIVQHKIQCFLFFFSSHG